MIKIQIETANIKQKQKYIKIWRFESIEIYWKIKEDLEQEKIHCKMKIWINKNILKDEAVNQ